MASIVGILHIAARIPLNVRADATFLLDRSVPGAPVPCRSLDAFRPMGLLELQPVTLAGAESRVMRLW